MVWRIMIQLIFSVPQRILDRLVELGAELYPMKTLGGNFGATYWYECDMSMYHTTHFRVPYHPLQILDILLILDLL